MQDIVKQIVDMDRKAREITAAVEQDRLNSEKEIAQKRVELRAEYLAKAREAIPSSESQERAAAAPQNLAAAGWRVLCAGGRLLRNLPPFLEFCRPTVYNSCVAHGNPQSVERIEEETYADCENGEGAL